VTSKGEVVLKETGLGWLTLFAASGTLICCALPIMLVTLGLWSPLGSAPQSLPLPVVSRY